MKTKRVLSIWLCICMLLTTCITATAAFAEPASGLIISAKPGEASLFKCRWKQWN